MPSPRIGSTARRSRCSDRVAQLVEHRPFKPRVLGSSPSAIIAVRPPLPFDVIRGAITLVRLSRPHPGLRCRLTATRRPPKGHADVSGLLQTLPTRRTPNPVMPQAVARLGTPMLIAHACWTSGRLLLWAESSERLLRAGSDPVASPAASSMADLSAVAEPTLEAGGPSAGRTTTAEHIGPHPFAADASEVRARLLGLRVPDAWLEADATPVQLRLPALDGRPLPSPPLIRQTGMMDDVPAADAEIGAVTVPVVAVPPAYALPCLALLGDVVQNASFSRGDSLLWFVTVGRFIGEFLTAQRVVPMLAHEADGGYSAHWRLWLEDEDARRRLALLLESMPPVVRAVCDRAQHNGWAVLDDLLGTLADQSVRRFLIANDLGDAITRFNPTDDHHVAWLSGLLGPAQKVAVDDERGLALFRGAREWLGRLTDVGEDEPFHLCFRLDEPAAVDRLPEFGEVDDRTLWPLTFYLQSSLDPDCIIPAERIWAAGGEVLAAQGARLERPQDRLLSELARAAKIYDRLEKVLSESRPVATALNTSEATRFLRDVKPVLEESGFTVLAPPWWDQPETRLSARLRVESDDIDFDGEIDPSSFAGQGPVGLDSLVRYSWQIAIGDQTLSVEEFNRLAKMKSALVRIHGRWVEVRPDDLSTATNFLSENAGGEISVRDALRLAYGSSRKRTGLRILGMDASGWVGRLFGSGNAANEQAIDGTGAGPDDDQIPMLPQPEAFQGTLRPYQLKGLSWLSFLDHFGLGACLADDMGLGKTIQLIALLLTERERYGQLGILRPTLLIVPTSVMANWERELHRFAPQLRVMVHHGIDRLSGDELVNELNQNDVIITSYGLAYRDREDFRKVNWWRICLDEAQNIKNPNTKQTTAILTLDARHRIALTGTPLENRLSELWSIMEFLNPGYLGTLGEFRRTFALPIERFRDAHRVAQLRQFVQPFILRRLKTDPTVIADLPEKQEYKVYCNLTAEQARLYEVAVNDMLEQADAAEGIRRRGLVLAGLVRLKQICNHPVQYLHRDREALQALSRVEAARSGKTARLVEMLDEVLAAGDSALIFTQFRQMGQLLSQIVRHDLDVDTLFLHGGTPVRKRQEMIDRFQLRDGSAPIFILSLKAGGLGLNLTAANHVFHFDRWWNPAIEKQATDRVFRIGQIRNVQVHKFVCSGTLEERIDEMIERKIELAEDVIGSGEQWLTEFSTQQLRELLQLRYEDVASDEDQASTDDEDDVDAVSGAHAVSADTDD